MHTTPNEHRQEHQSGFSAAFVYITAITPTEPSKCISSTVCATALIYHDPMEPARGLIPGVAACLIALFWAAISL